ncbi:hypothetical protein M0P65_00010 [Candidatus Gracilibacteria bacterium]|nr:hypothetical protein [Candidatus Gracilibacteria bacterium]
MRKYIKYAVFILFFAGVSLNNSNIYASSNPSGDFTYIDCENGSDTSGTPFDSAKPYLSLKQGIEKSVKYINDNGLSNNTGIGIDYTSSFFNIAVKAGCLFNGIDGNSINLDFAPSNNSSLNIYGVGGNFVIDNVYFNLSRIWAGNIFFKNVNFWRNDLIGFYFSGYNSVNYGYNGSGIKIQNSFINISTGRQIMNYNNSYVYPYNYYYQPGGFIIENSLINAYINTHYYFRLPIYLKNNKIVIKNSNTDGIKYDVGFYVAGRNSEGYNYGSTNLISNEINLGGNSFKTDNNYATFINNKFTNVKNFVVGTDETTIKYNGFINNQVESQNIVNITSNESAFNNLFINGFTNTRDIDNYKRNFANSIPSGEKGIGWIFKKDLSSNQNIYANYKTLYSEITGNDLPVVNNPLFILLH